MSFYCKICARMPIDSINKSIKEAKVKFDSEIVDKSGIKSKAKIIKAVIKDLALNTGINLDWKNSSAI